MKRQAAITNVSVDGDDSAKVSCEAVAATRDSDLSCGDESVDLAGQSGGPNAIDRFLEESLGDGKAPRAQRSVSEVAALALRLVNEQHPDAVAAFVYGSSVEGRASPHSDVDLLVISAGGSWTKGWITFEQQVFDVQSIAFFDLAAGLEDCRTKRIGTLHYPLLRGLPILKTDRFIAYENELSSLLARPLPVPGPGELDAARAMVSCRLIETLHAHSFQERVFSGLSLFDAITRVIYLTDGVLDSAGKARIKLTFAKRPGLPGKLCAAYAELLDDNPEPLCRLAAHVLAGAGGGCLVGYRRNIPIRPASPR